MNFANGIYNARMHSTKSIALLHEGTSHRSDYASFAKRNGNLTLEENSCEAYNSISFSKTTPVQTGSSRAPWLNAFLRKSARYEDFLATQEACNLKNTPNHNATPQVTSAGGVDAARYAQMRRISSRPLLSRNSGAMPFSLEWALDELLAADKWLHEKYVSSAAQKNSVRGQAGDGTGSNGNLNNFPIRNIGPGDSHGMLEVGTSYNVRSFGIVTEDSVNLLNNFDENNDHRSNTLPRNVKDLFTVGKKKTPSTCSLPDTSRMEVISRFLAAES